MTTLELRDGGHAPHSPFGVLTSATVEKLPVRVAASADAAALLVADEIASLIRERQDAGRGCVLGLATGNTPTRVYGELVRMHREESLSFAGVTTFNLDEYVGLEENDPRSYASYMRRHLFDHVDLDPAKTHLPITFGSAEELAAACAAYEQAIVQAGGIDLQILGIGRTGHIAFNEPGSSRHSRTRPVTLDTLTRRDAAAGFSGRANVPRHAVTMGVATILAARRIVLLAFGQPKAAVVAAAVEGEVKAALPASYLQDHPAAECIVDVASAGSLTRSTAPWMIGTVDWDAATIRSAVVWLSRRSGAPILALTEEDYNENGLEELVTREGGAYELNLRVFRSLQGTVTGWPAGKPQHRKLPGDITRPQDDVFPKRIVVFSPHPDDDVISMGGTLIRLADQGHEVHVVYQTSGNIAVFDSDVRDALATTFEFSRELGIDADPRLIRALACASHEGVDRLDGRLSRALKGAIRRVEAAAGARACGVEEERLHFLNLPFYETGCVTKRPLGEDDTRIVADLLRQVRPHQIYAAGDLADPHDTHRMCLRAVSRALDACDGEPWRSTCQVWLYRGAWQEWGVEEIDMAVPLSPEEVLRKREAIFKHESQKDRPVFPGGDSREFWQRAEQRNHETAAIYRAIGLPAYPAIEGFVAADESSFGEEAAW